MTAQLGHQLWADWFNLKRNSTMRKKVKSSKTCRSCQTRKDLMLLDFFGVCNECRHTRVFSKPS